MLAIGLRILIGLEIVLYATLAVRFVDASPFLVGLIAVSALLAVRFSLTLLTYAFAWKYQSPAPPLGPARTLRMIAAEWGAFIANFVVVSPFEKLWMGPDRLRPSVERPPLLLVHGYGCSRAASAATPPGLTPLRCPSFSPSGGEMSVTCSLPSRQL
mgnify:CR=1 FL=1